MHPQHTHIQCKPKRLTMMTSSRAWDTTCGMMPNATSQAAVAPFHLRKVPAASSIIKSSSIGGPPLFSGLFYMHGVVSLPWSAQETFQSPQRPWSVWTLEHFGTHLLASVATNLANVSTRVKTSRLAYSGFGHSCFSPNSWDPQCPTPPTALELDELRMHASGRDS